MPRASRAAQYAEYSKFDSVKRWMNNLGDSQATRVGALYSIIRFSEFVSKTPDQLVKERAKQLASRDPLVRGQMEDNVLAFAKEVKGAHMYALYAKSFFAANHMSLSVKIKRPATQREEAGIPDDEKLKALVNRMHGPTLKTLVLFLAESGARIGSVLALRYRHIRGDFEANKIPCKVNFPAGITKGEIAYTGFIGPDTVQALHKILEGRTLDDDSFVFVSKTGRPLSETMTIGRIQINAGYVGLIRKKTGMKEFSPHMLRKRAQTILEGAGIPLNWVDLLLGHVPRGAQGQAYSRPTEDQLRQSYEKGMPLLRILGPPKVFASEEAKKETLVTTLKLLSGLGVQPKLTDLIRNEIEKAPAGEADSVKDRIMRYISEAGGTVSFAGISLFLRTGEKLKKDNKPRPQEPTERFCSQCGRESKPTSKYCPYCGSKVG